MQTPEERKAKNYLHGKKWREENREKFRVQQKAYRLKVRKEAIDHYGGKCICCGETQYEFLTFDHINGNGKEHRRTRKESAIARWLKVNNWPQDIQILCFNCNCAKGMRGSCPHSRYTVTGTGGPMLYVVSNTTTTSGMISINSY